MPEQIEAAGCEPARNVAGGRSVGMSWGDVEDADADVVLIACCDFDLQRNVADALAKAGFSRSTAIDSSRDRRSRSRWARPSWCGARTGRWSSTRTTCLRKGWAGAASTSSRRWRAVAGFFPRRPAPTLRLRRRAAFPQRATGKAGRPRTPKRSHGGARRTTTLRRATRCSPHSRTNRLASVVAVGVATVPSTTRTCATGRARYAP